MRQCLHISAVYLICITAVVGTAAHQVVERIAAGDASLAGRVIDSDSQRPLEGAIVTLSSFDRKRVLKTLTDATGRYSFDGIATSGYFVSAFMDGYGTQDHAPSGTLHGRPEVVHVVQGRTTTGVNLLLRRAGVITGQVTLTGAPLNGAVVTAIMTPDDRSFSNAAAPPSSRTDSQGAYTLRNVPPGLYWVSAEQRAPELMKIPGRGEFNPTFFPGTRTIADAAPVRVGVGETVRRVNIGLLLPEYLRISGQVFRRQSEGAIEANLVAGGWSVRTIHVAEDGTFDITHLQPGRYTFWARARTADGHEAAAMTVDVSSEMTGLAMPLLPTGTLSGRVVIDDGTRLPGGLQVAAVQADAGKQIDPLERDRGDVADDGRFELRGLFGERILRVLGLDPQWAVDRVLRGTSPIQSVSITADEQADGFTIVLKRR